MDPERFVDQSLLHNFTCLVCLMVVKDPDIVEHSDCKRLFCRPCLEPIAYTSNKCPACSQCVSGKMDKMNYIVRDMVYSKLVMKCSNQGCFEQFPLSQREHHEVHHCPFRMVICVDCRKRISIDSLIEHQMLTCEMRYVICDVPGCGKQMLRKNIDEHGRLFWKIHKQLYEEIIKRQKDEINELKNEQLQEESDESTHQKRLREPSAFPYDDDTVETLLPINSFKPSQHIEIPRSIERKTRYRVSHNYIRALQVDKELSGNENMINLKYQ